MQENTFSTRSPLTGKLIREFAFDPSARIDATVQIASAAQRGWAQATLAERGLALARFADVLQAQQMELAQLMALEMGKPVRQGRIEIEKCAWNLRFVAEQGAAFLADESIQTEAANSYLTYRPLGLVLMIMPWNFPFWQVIRGAASALMAGNGVIIKHAPNVPQCSLAIVRCAEQSGLPAGLVSQAFASLDDTHALIRDPRIAAVSFTGSTQGGRAVASAAGGALKKCVLELGGSDPYVILTDADMPLAARTCATSRLLNAGQTCISAKRFIVVESCYAAFIAAFQQEMAMQAVGDPMLDTTDVGPMARSDLREQLHRQVESSIAAGANCLFGGALPEGAGYFYPPTVLVDVRPGMAAFDEETFGPVAAVVRAANDEDALRLANATPYGLGAAIFSRDVLRAEALAREQLESGNVVVNGLVKSDPRLPFGGVKASGIGRELGRHGMLEFVNIKSVVVS